MTQLKPAEGSDFHLIRQPALVTRCRDCKHWDREWELVIGSGDSDWVENRFGVEGKRTCKLITLGTELAEAAALETGALLTAPDFGCVCGEAVT